MKSNALTIKQYIDSIPEDRKKVINRLIDVISHNIPKGFSKVISYGYPGFVIPHSLYPMDTTVIKNYHYHLLVLLRKSILWLCTIVDYMLIQNL